MPGPDDKLPIKMLNDRVLVKLEGEVVKALQSIRRGLSALDERFPPEGAEAAESASAERTHAQL